MRPTDSFVTRLIRWWCHQAKDDVASCLTEDFVYDVGLEAVNREDFLLIHAGSGTFDDVEVIGLQCCEGGASVMFEATDSITGLRQRVCWMIYFDTDRVKRIVACVGNVLTLQE